MYQLSTKSIFSDLAFQWPCCKESKYHWDVPLRDLNLSLGLKREKWSWHVIFSNWAMYTPVGLTHTPWIPYIHNFLKPKNTKWFGMRINQKDCTRQEAENILQLIYHGICPCYFNAMHPVIYGNMCVCVSMYWICVFWVAAELHLLWSSHSHSQGPRLNINHISLANHTASNLSVLQRILEYSPLL